MKHLVRLWIVLLTIFVALGDSQLFQQNENCKTFKDLVNCNAYYQCCVDNVILHKFCPVGMEWNVARNICEYSERCEKIVEYLNDVKVRNSVKFIDLQSDVFPLRPGRPPSIRPPLPPINNGFVKIKFNKNFLCY